MLRKEIVTAMIAVWAIFGTNATAAAPARLYGKSVVVTWSETLERKTALNPVASSITQHGDFNVYISSAGRVFNRLTYGGFLGRQGYRTASSDQINGEGSGQTRNVVFSDLTMTSVKLMDGGARRIPVTFTSDFFDCSAEVLTGKSAGGE